MSDEQKFYISIDRCPVHHFNAISVGDHETGLRLTPSKCCGSWNSVYEWRITPRACDDIIEEFTRIKELISEEHQPNKGN